MPVTEGPPRDTGQEGETLPLYILSSPDDIGSFADGVVTNPNISLGLPNFAPEELREGIRSFLEIVNSSPHVDSIAISRRITPVEVAFLDIDVLWSSLLEEAQETEPLHKGHADFWTIARPNVDSFFYIHSPARHPTIDSFNKYMQNRPYRTLLAIAELRRKSLV